jgi:hypothetical protein
MNANRKVYCLTLIFAAVAPGQTFAETVDCGTIEDHNWEFQISQMPPPGRDSCSVNKQSIYSNAVTWSQDDNTGMWFAQTVESFDADGLSWSCNDEANMINMLRAECSADDEPDNRIVIEGKQVFSD